MDANAKEEMRELMEKTLAETAETLDGVALFLSDIAISPDMPRDQQSRLFAVKDAVVICRDRIDALTDMVDS